MHYTQKHCQAAYGSIFFVCPADALPLLHALMLLSALVARSFLRCYIPAYSCLLFALMPLCGLQCHTLTRCCVCLAVLLLHHVQGARFCHLFPLLLLMLSNLSDIPTMAVSFYCPADALLTALCCDAFIGSFGSLFPAVGYPCICLLYARSDAFVCLTVAYPHTLTACPLPSCSC